jgi:hypothetical protein
MALIIEDGTGIVDATAYVSVPFVENYFTGGRLDRFNELSDKDSVIVTATQLVDISYEWLGTRKTLDQGLSWPRTGAVFDGFTVEGVPAAVKKAVCEAVWLSMTEESFFSTENDKEVARERVDVIDVSYVNPKDRKETATRFEILDKLLRNLYHTKEKSSGSSVGSARVERC